MIFQTFVTYFLDEIIARSYGYLLHEVNSDHYIPSLLEKLYNSFTLDNIDNNTHSIEVNWKEERKVVDLQLLLDLTDIPHSRIESSTHEFG